MELTTAPAPAASLEEVQALFAYFAVKQEEARSNPRDSLGGGGFALPCLFAAPYRKDPAVKPYQAKALCQARAVDSVFGGLGRLYRTGAPCLPTSSHC